MLLKPSKTENINFNTPLKVWDFPEADLEPALAPQFPFVYLYHDKPAHQSGSAALILVNTSNKGTEKGGDYLFFRFLEGFAPFRCV